MRKQLWIIVLLGLGLLLAACSTSDAAPEVRSTGDVKRITAADAKALLDDGMAVLYDTRSLNQYLSMRATGAVSLPEGEEDARFGELPTDKALIFYCT